MVGCGKHAWGNQANVYERITVRRLSSVYTMDCHAFSLFPLWKQIPWCLGRTKSVEPSIEVMSYWNFYSEFWWWYSLIDLKGIWKGKEKRGLVNVICWFCDKIQYGSWHSSYLAQQILSWHTPRPLSKHSNVNFYPEHQVWNLQKLLKRYLFQVTYLFHTPQSEIKLEPYTLLKRTL